MPFSLNARQATGASNVRGVWKGLAQQIHQSASDPGHQLAGVNVPFQSLFCIQSGWNSRPARASPFFEEGK